MAESREVRDVADLLGAFDERIEKLSTDGVYSHELRREIPWAEATELNKVEAIVWVAQSVSREGPAVPGAYTLGAIERNVDFGGLPSPQREMLLEVRAKIDTGALPGADAARGMDRAWSALNWITGIDKFDRWLETYKADGLYNRPKNTPWADVPEAKKVNAIVGLACQESVPGAYALAAIEREVDYDKLSPWRRAALEGLRARLDGGGLECEQPLDTCDRGNYALRLAEFEARVEDYKKFGDRDDWGAHRRWEEFSEEQKLDRIVPEAGRVHLHFEPREYEIIDREVDLTRVPEGRRRSIDAVREMTLIGPEEYRRREEAKYAPPNEAAAAFKERIEEGLWTTCFTDGETFWADWSDLTAEAKLHELARVMDWERVPETYFRTMAERELKVKDLPPEKRTALENPRENRHVFALRLDDGIDASPPGQDENQVQKAVKTDEIPWNAEQRKAKHRELFDTANRVQVAELIKEKALDPDIAMNTSAKVRAVYLQQAETTWDSVREELEFRSDAEVKETLDVFKAKEAELGNQEPKTLMDHLQAGGLFLSSDAPRPDQGESSGAVRDTTRNLVEAIWLDVWPRSGAIVDFGLKSQEHYEALYYPVRDGEVTAEALDAALGNGERLTALARAAHSNPHRDILFRTDWDDLRPEPEDDGDRSERGKQEHGGASGESHPGSGAKSKGMYQVWHDMSGPNSWIAHLMGDPLPRFPDDYVHAANVHAESLGEAARLTSNTGSFLDGKGNSTSWEKCQGVEAMVNAPRDTSACDVIVDPQGKAHRFDGQGFEAITLGQRNRASGEKARDDSRGPKPARSRGKRLGR
jgi:hypothetical protein